MIAEICPDMSCKQDIGIARSLFMIGCEPNDQWTFAFFLHVALRLPGQTAIAPSIENTLHYFAVQIEFEGS